jgi:hypothetical protein
MAYQRPKLVAEMAKATGVSEDDVGKVLDQLGLSRIYKEAHQSNKGRDLSLDSAKVAFRIGKSTIVV